MWCYVSEEAAVSERVLSEVLAPTLGRPLEALRERVAPLVAAATADSA